MNSGSDKGGGGGGCCSGKAKTKGNGKDSNLAVNK